MGADLNYPIPLESTQEMHDSIFAIAHVRQTDNTRQPLADHLTGVASLTEKHAAKIGLPAIGELLGLLHDVGKYSPAFQHYLRSATGQIDPDADEWVDAKGMKGKIDHSTAGAQLIWQRWQGYGPAGQLAAQIVAVCVASHHSGLIDCLKPDGSNGFLARMGKERHKTHLDEALECVDPEVIVRIDALSQRDNLLTLLQRLKAITSAPAPLQRDFYLGMTTRLLFSALIDGDRQDSADFENPANRPYRLAARPAWSIAIDRLEQRLASWPEATPIDAIRRAISDNCAARAADARGLYTLTVPTGGGKTLASLRFALHHARHHQLDRILYVIPYTSIIEQNAAAIRTLLEEASDPAPWVLEHHSNLDPEQQSWHSKLASENWQTPIVLTTMVQLLETLFAGGTRSARRLHQLANSVIICDEIQTLPVNCVHLFCNALNYFVTHAGTTALLCTATQPLLHRLKNPDKGQLDLRPENELAGDVGALFRQLQRVRLIDRRVPRGWQEGELVDLALEQLQRAGNVLIIVNTKGWAARLYLACRDRMEESALFHLSTHQCPAQRKAILTTVKDRLAAGLPTLCISTQLIEAGVDIDFGCVIRFLAGLDSIAQAAGRCNRHGHREQGEVIIVNPAEEPINRLIDIREGRDSAKRVLDELGSDQWLTPSAMDRYFDYYFYRRAEVMAYPVADQHDTLLNLLASNPQNGGHQDGKRLNQSFATAAAAFRAIDAPTRPLLVPWGEGETIIAGLCAVAGSFDVGRYRQLLRAAQPYSINLYDTTWRRLQEAGAIHAIAPGEGVFYLDPRHYSHAFGVSTEAVSHYDFLEV
jgi:CRISPR-associated endonuclease/helicase Cas3